MTKKIYKFIEEIDNLKQELEKLRPIKPEYNKAISQKLKLEFNYHSNHIEGNTLTPGETKTLALRGLEASVAKNLRDVYEMKAHIDTFDRLGFLTDKILTKDFLPIVLDQKFIKELHKMIFIEDKIIENEENGITMVTKIPAGEYKIHQNHVNTKNEVKFEYSEPGQVQMLMSDLLVWYNMKRDKTHPLVLASLFHYKFIRIHPFGDGNGRMARLLMNLILQSSGHPIAIVKSEPEYKRYYLNSLMLVDNYFPNISDCLISSDTENYEPFILEIGKYLVNSYEIMIKGAKGESILDVLDIIKIAEKREKIKTNNKQYSLDEILLDPHLLDQAQEQIDKIKSALEDYNKKVLSQLFVKIDISTIKTNNGVVEIFDQWKSNEFINKLSFDIKYTLQDPKIPNPKTKFIKTFTIRINNEYSYFYQINLHVFENSIFKTLFSGEIYFIDTEFDEKLTRLIKAIDDYVVSITETK